MNRFIQLIRNEQMKLYLLRSTWIMVGLLSVLLIGMGILTKVLDEQDPRIATDEWRTVLEEENEQFEQEIAEDEFMETFNAGFIEENMFYLENDIQPTKYGALSFVYENSIFVLLVGLFSIIVAAGIVANEHRWGTIKLLLIRPISRTTILFSKYTSVLVFALSMMAFLIVGLFVIGLILFGFEGTNPMYLISTSDGTLELTSLYKGIVADYGFPFIEIIMLLTLAFMISTIFKNNSLALGATLFLMFTGSQIYFWFEKYAWSKYILFAHTDFSQFSASNTPIFEGNTPLFSIIVYAAYYLLFLFLAWFMFTKRDVAGD